MLYEASYNAKCGGLKILTPRQILQRLRIALGQVKAGNTSENLLNEIRQIIYSLYWVYHQKYETVADNRSIRIA